MIRVLVHRDGAIAETTDVDVAWLAPDAREQVWVILNHAGEPERRLLSEVFQFHELAVEDALSAVHHPKIETYEGFLYLILHGIVGHQPRSGFVTRDVDFFLGRNFLVTVHQEESRSIEEERAVCLRHASLVGGGAAGLLHRIVDRMVDHYRPEVDTLEDRLEELEKIVFESPRENPLRAILKLKADIGSLRRVTLPQRDAIGKLARREFPQIPQALTYRFRDVYDNLVRLSDESVMFQDRVSGLLDAYLSSQSNRLNRVMKVLTVIATIFMPLTVLTGLYGMNVQLPMLPGGEGAQFWWVMGIMTGTLAVMLWAFRRLRWL